MNTKKRIFGDILKENMLYKDIEYMCGNCNNIEINMSGKCPECQSGLLIYNRNIEKMIDIKEIQTVHGLDKKKIKINMWISWDDSGVCWLHNEKPLYYKDNGTWWSKNGEMIKVRSLNNKSLALNSERVKEIIIK